MKLLWNGLGLAEAALQQRYQSVSCDLAMSECNAVNSILIKFLALLLLHVELLKYTWFLCGSECMSVCKALILIPLTQMGVVSSLTGIS